MPDATIASLDGGILVTLHNDLVVNQGGQVNDQANDQVSDQDAIMKSFEAIQNEFGLLSDRIGLGKEKNSAFLRSNYGVFTGYLQGIYGINSE